MNLKTKLFHVFNNGISKDFRGFRVRKQWGPILEERIKQIVLANEKREDAEKALRVRFAFKLNGFPFPSLLLCIYMDL